MARQGSLQRHGGERYERAPEPHPQLQQANVPGFTHRGRSTRQPAQRSHAQRSQLQTWREGMMSRDGFIDMTSVLLKFSEICFLKSNKISLLKLL